MFFVCWWGWCVYEGRWWWSCIVFTNVVLPPASSKEGDMNWPMAFYITLVSGVGLFCCFFVIIFSYTILYTWTFLCHHAWLTELTDDCASLPHLPLFQVNVIAVYSLVVLPQAKWQTFLLSYLLWPLSGVGITGGCHRLWCHRAYVGHWTVRLYLMLAASTANQGCIYHWVRDHRVHHKHTETDGDPHNAQRGFFFAHMGWLYVQKVYLKCIGCFSSHCTFYRLCSNHSNGPFSIL